ncbi:N-6 DNA methylase [Candidatus Uhrbacteria bacterium]|nr:N-6 DNA methylase [Candidatus Uhrbacteria bacterium]
MSVARIARENKRQLGQFMTPRITAAAIVNSLNIAEDDTILEPSFGEGAFIFEIVSALAQRLGKQRAQEWAQTKLFGCEVDPRAFAAFSNQWERLCLGPLPSSFECCDFLKWLPPGCDKGAAINRKKYVSSHLEFFDLVIGNPPFGGSIDRAIQDDLDDILGFRDGMKIKKETYAFFITKSLDLLKLGGRLCFICSDTLLTIPTMRGLRNWLHGNCDVRISEVPESQFVDSKQDMLLVTLTKHNRKAPYVTVFDHHTRIEDIEATENLSWRVNGEYARYFTGQTLGDKMVASSGMTIGNNALFLRHISDGIIEEPYDFSFGREQITLQREIMRARLGKIAPARRKRIEELERLGETQRVVVWTPREAPAIVAIPHEDYRYYNKATPQIIYSEPAWAIFWRDEGDYVYTFKKTGNWYLHGVGGKPYFGREGLTWALIAPRLRTRYLPAGYILDSGAPCAFLRPGVEHDELLFIMGWTLTDLCTRILKNVINHTRNIQSKDFERIPYPAWMSSQARADAIGCVKQLLGAARHGQVFDFNSPEVVALNGFYAYIAPGISPHKQRAQHDGTALRLPLW